MSLLFAPQSLNKHSGPDGVFAEVWVNMITFANNSLRVFPLIARNLFPRYLSPDCRTQWWPLAFLNDMRNSTGRPYLLLNPTKCIWFHSSQILYMYILNRFKENSFTAFLAFRWSSLSVVYSQLLLRWMPKLKCSYLPLYYWQVWLPKVKASTVPLLHKASDLLNR